jgi:processive 1,2-diacylglycerol beta-glucosyltransferase
MVASELQHHHVPAAKIAVTGIPIRHRFSSESVQALLAERDEHLLKENFEANRPLVLLMGGGAGLLSDVSDWITLLETVDLQFVVICGRNERLYKKLQDLESKRIRVLGYTNEVDRWMAMANLIITKPGGITVTEALAMKLPLLLFRPIPGQEEQNAEFALSIGAAKIAYDVHTVEQLLNDFLASPQALKEMREATKRVEVDGAAEKIAQLLVRLGDRSKASAGSDDAWAT